MFKFKDLNQPYQDSLSPSFMKSQMKIGRFKRNISIPNHIKVSSQVKPTVILIAHMKFFFSVKVRLKNLTILKLYVREYEKKQKFIFPRNSIN